MLLQIGVADSATQVGRQVGNDVVEGVGHRREGVVGSENHVVATEDRDGLLKCEMVVSH